MTSNESNLISINPIGKIIGPDGKEYTCSQVIAEIAKIEREIQNQKNTIKELRSAVREKIDREADMYRSIFDDQ